MNTLQRNEALTATCLFLLNECGATPDDVKSIALDLADEFACHYREMMADDEPEPPTFDEALGRKCDAEARYRRDMIDAGRGHLLGD